MSETLDHTFRDWYKKTDIVTSEFSSLKWQDEKNHVFLDAMSCQLAEASKITLSYKSISSAVLLRMWDTARNSDKYIKDEKKVLNRYRGDPPKDEERSPNEQAYPVSWNKVIEI